MQNNEEDYSDDIVQRLSFSTPEKARGDEKIQLSADDYTRRLFESNKKIGEIGKQIILVMPFFERDLMGTEELIESIHILLRE